MQMILSADEAWGIGKGNQLLFRIPPDMRYFKDKTMGGAVIMGRKTWESLPDGKPLDGRINIVLTGNPGSIKVDAKGLSTGTEPLLCTNLTELSVVLEKLPVGPDRAWVIGGAEIFRLLMPYCREAYITRFLTTDQDADRRMEDLDKAENWIKVAEGAVEEWEGLRYRFDRYENSNVQVLPREQS